MLPDSRSTTFFAMLVGHLVSPDVIHTDMMDFKRVEIQSLGALALSPFHLDIQVFLRRFLPTGEVNSDFFYYCKGFYSGIPEKIFPQH